MTEERFLEILRGMTTTDHPYVGHLAGEAIAPTLVAVVHAAADFLEAASPLIGFDGGVEVLAGLVSSAEYVDGEES